MIKRLFSRVLASLAPLLLPMLALAQLQVIPPNVAPNPTVPMVMMSVSKDYTMFWRAYTDFEDIDFDGIIDYTFKASFQYYGYFDPQKCYLYSVSNKQFEPSKAATADSTGNFYCNSATTDRYWSGNFLNWATMSRMDVLRKMLYGGKRSTDSTSTTLELSFVPRNTQAIVKYYNGSDLNKVTPFNSAGASNFAGITLCRRHLETSGSSESDNFTPIIRVAVGNYILWNMTEVRSCNWDGEVSYTWRTDTTNYLKSNYVTPAGITANTQSAYSHASKTPVQSTQGGTYTYASSTNGPDFVARVKVCDTSLLGTERCQAYPNGNSKPIGLLHEFGLSSSYGSKAARAEFGLMMGSYDNNLNGGVLRKNMSEINDEIDANSGQFLAPATGKGGIIRSFNEITLYGYNLNTGNYADSCYSDSITNGSCPSWGNPVGQILLESFRYFAGKSAQYSPGTKDSNIGLPTVSAWADPITTNGTINANKKRSDLYGKGICRPLNVLTVTGGFNSYDNTLSRFSDLGAPNGVEFYTKTIGDQEGITGTTRLIGAAGSTSDLQCSGKNVGNLSSANGICPDGPNFKGSYLGAGAAFYANTNRVRSDLTLPSDAPSTALKVRSYGVSMSGGAANIVIPVPNTNKSVYITPASLDNQRGSDPKLPGNLVDFKVLQRSTDGKSGTFLALWQHDWLGEDQDQDMLGTIRYVVDDTSIPPQLKIYTQTLESDTGSTRPFAFGYTLVGTNKDGVHFHSAINSYVSSESADVSGATLVGTGGSAPGGCTGSPRLCVAFGSGNSTKYYKGETLMTYNMVGSDDATMKEPLWYIAKYGSFKDDSRSPTGLPDSPAKWDVRRSDGQPCGASGQPSCSDGVPDNYYQARRPDLLETALRQVLSDIVETSNSAPAVSRPDLRAGDYKYVAQFDAADLRGEIASYKVKDNGDFDTTPTAQGHTNLLNATGLQVITNVGTVGTAFTWSGIGAATGGASYQSSLQGTSTVAYGQAVLDYLRGSRTNESPAGYKFRTRSINSTMGGIVNSNPWLQDLPIANLFGSAYSGYGAFKTAQSTRQRLVWVGAEDGRLYSFTANTLAPVLSYVPQLLAPRLTALTSATSLTAYMDGSPFTGDVQLSGGTWRTYLFSSLGRGAKGIFALDVTNTGALNEANASSIFKWQFSSSDDADLGYVISEGGTHPVSGQASQIVRLPNGKFAVIAGNGVGSTNGKAALFILYVDGPDGAGNWTGKYEKIVVDAPAAKDNGLNQPFWVDTDGDGIADTIYATDIKGQLWKIDVSSTSSASWGVAYGKALYVAKDAAGNQLPAISAPVSQFHPMGGQIVVYGTGKAITDTDYPDSTKTHRIFGIWDKPSYAASPGSIPTGTSELQTRTWNVTPTGSLFQSTGTTIDWTTKKGWFISIPISSGMQVSNAEYAKDGSRDVAIPLVFPVQNTDSCMGGSQGLLTQINPITGLLGSNIFGNYTDTLGNSYTVVGIVVVDQRFRLAEDSTARCGAGLNCARVVGQTTDITLKRGTTNSRIFWREVPGLRTTSD
jgi:type IV pilus assembly protein PilY1